MDYWGFPEEFLIMYFKTINYKQKRPGSVGLSICPEFISYALLATLLTCFFLFMNAITKSLVLR
mgnify:FL=1